MSCLLPSSSCHVLKTEYSNKLSWLKVEIECTHYPNKNPRVYIKITQIIIYVKNKNKMHCRQIYKCVWQCSYKNFKHCLFKGCIECFILMAIITIVWKLIVHI